MLNFGHERLRLIKQNGQIIENINAQIDSKKIYIDDITISIDEKDIFERVLSNGDIEQFIVTDKNFIKGFKGLIPDCYEVFVEKANKQKNIKLGEIINNYNITNESGKININSMYSSINITLPKDKDELFENLITIAKSLNNSDEIIAKIKDMYDSIEKPTFGEKYNLFIQSIANHITIFSPFLPLLTTFLTR